MMIQVDVEGLVLNHIEADVAFNTENLKIMLGVSWTLFFHTHKIGTALQNRGAVAIFGEAEHTTRESEAFSEPLSFMARVPNMPSVCSVYTRKIWRALPCPKNTRFRSAVPDFCACGKKGSRHSKHHFQVLCVESYISLINWEYLLQICRNFLFDSVQPRHQTRLSR